MLHEQCRTWRCVKWCEMARRRRRGTRMLGSSCSPCACRRERCKPGRSARGRGHASPGGASLACAYLSFATLGRVCHQPHCPSRIYAPGAAAKWAPLRASHASRCCNHTARVGQLCQPGGVITTLPVPRGVPTHGTRTAAVPRGSHAALACCRGLRAIFHLHHGC